MRVWITGVGVVSPLALDADRTFRALLAGERAVRELTLFDPGDQRARLAAEVRGLSVRDVAPAGRAEEFSRGDAMALVAAREALAHAGLAVDRSVGLCVGGTTAGMFETEARIAAMHKDPARRVPEPAMVTHPLSATEDRLREVLGPFGPSRTLCSACSSGANALVQADLWLRAGLAERVLAGGVDALCRLTFTGFNLLAAMDPRPCRPFDAQRAGLNLGEAAAFLVLESEASARARGAVPIAEFAGWAVGAEGSHITQPEPSGATAARLITQALARAGLRAEDVGYVNAHGTATPHNDRMEAAALRAGLGAHAERAFVSSCKGQIGHTLGAAGAIEAVISALAIARDALPPTVGLEQPDAACALRHVQGRAEHASVDAALSNSFGFGGGDTVLAFTRPGRFAPPAAHAPRPLVLTAGSVLGPRGPRDARALLDDVAHAPSPPAGPSPFDPDAALDPARARKLDALAARVTAVAQRALASTPAVAAPERLGVVTGISFGLNSVAPFLDAIVHGGWQRGKPAVFPNLLNSSPGCHASIYLGARGPLLTVTERGVSAESALALGAELIAAREADAVLACAASEHNAIGEHSLGPLCLGSAQWRGPRTDGASALLLEAEDSAARRGARPLARVLGLWSGDDAEALSVPAPEKNARASVWLPRESTALVERAASRGWGEAERFVLATHAGEHEALGGMALVAAAAALADGRTELALVLGETPGRWTAVLLGALAPASHGGAASAHTV